MIPLTPYEKIMRIFYRLNSRALPGNDNYLYVYHDHEGVDKYEIRIRPKPTYNVKGELVTPNGERLGVAFNH